MSSNSDTGALGSIIFVPKSYIYLFKFGANGPFFFSEEAIVIWNDETVFLF